MPPVQGPAPQAPARAKGKKQHLHITDSIGRNVLYPVLESATGSLILPVKATPSVYDERARNPRQNVQAVLRNQLSNGKRVHTVILGAPSVDITNQDVSRGIIEDNTVETMASARNMVEAANYAIETGQVEQCLLMEHAPRFDTPRDDPYGARPHLARLANETLRRVVAESRHRDKLIVGSHTGLPKEGKDGVDMMTNTGDNWRCRNVSKGKYDGIHYYSKKGQQGMTNSMLEAMRQAGLVRGPRAARASGATGQWERVRRGPRGGPPAPAPFEIPLSNRFSGN